MSLYFFKDKKAHRVAAFTTKTVLLFCHRNKDGSMKPVHGGATGPHVWSGDVLLVEPGAKDSLCQDCEKRFSGTP